jgi:hypothetical protein
MEKLVQTGLSPEGSPKSRVIEQCDAKASGPGLPPTAATAAATAAGGAAATTTG